MNYGMSQPMGGGGGSPALASTPGTSGVFGVAPGYPESWQNQQHAAMVPGLSDFGY
jgi:hypothetical protein